MCTSCVEHKLKRKRLKRKRVVNEAELAFWAKVAEQYPTATTGDLDPLMVSYLSDIMDKAVRQWIEYNVPK